MDGERYQREGKVMEITIKPDDIDTLVKDALIKSSIGSLITETVKAATKLGVYNSPIDEAVKVIVRNIASDLLNERYKEKITELIAATLAEKLTDEWLKQQADELVYKIMRDR